MSNLLNNIYDEIEPLSPNELDQLTAPSDSTSLLSSSSFSPSKFSLSSKDNETIHSSISDYNSTNQSIDSENDDSSSLQEMDSMRKKIRALEQIVEQRALQLKDLKKELNEKESNIMKFQQFIKKIEAQATNDLTLVNQSTNVDENTLINHNHFPKDQTNEIQKQQDSNNMFNISHSNNDNHFNNDLIQKDDNNNLQNMSQHVESNPKQQIVKNNTNDKYSEEYVQELLKQIQFFEERLSSLEGIAESVESNVESNEKINHVLQMIPSITSDANKFISETNQQLNSNDPNAAEIAIAKARLEERTIFRRMLSSHGLSWKTVLLVLLFLVIIAMIINSITSPNNPYWRPL